MPNIWRFNAAVKVLVTISPGVVAFGAPVSQQQPLFVPLTLSNPNATQVAFDWHSLPSSVPCNSRLCVDTVVDATITPKVGLLGPQSSTSATLQRTYEETVLTGDFALPLTCQIAQGPKEPTDNISIWVEGTVPRAHIRLLSPEARGPSELALTCS
uniref:Secreted protein n=1 Tax=Achlya hypogyna TaxID=1202772 RepID=A0A0A7CN47_ACHHY|nr:secreted protein [Achlya hypogyna]